MKNKIKIAFIGSGNMASAIIGCIDNPVAKQAFKDNGDVVEIVVADRDEAKLMKFKGVCEVTCDNAYAVSRADIVFLCVKPQSAEQALSALDLSEKIVVSIMAGVSVARLKELTGSARIVRVMPNLNARVGESFNAYVAEGLSESELLNVQKLLGSFGMYRQVKEEDMDAVTGITGSGPAFVFMVIKAFCDEAVAQGFDSATAKTMAVQTVLGSALTAERADVGLDALVDSVCSKGGTTIEGVNVLKERGLESAIRDAVRAAIARSKELCKN